MKALVLSSRQHCALNSKKSAVLCAMMLSALMLFFSAGLCDTTESRDFFKVDVQKQKTKMEKDFGDGENFLLQTKLQNVRGVADLLEHEMKQLKNNLTKEEAAALRTRIDKLKSDAVFKEDSLVKRTMEILYSQGVDLALKYTQNDLRMLGVSEKKIQEVEQVILEKAPEIKVTQERDAIARAVIALKSGTPVDSSIDPYIVKTAQRMIKAHEDSVKAVEYVKQRKQMEEKERLERAQMDKELKIKKKEEELLAKIKTEEEKKHRAQENAERVKMEAETKEKERLTRMEDEQKKQTITRQEKTKKYDAGSQKNRQEQQVDLDEDQQFQKKDYEKLSQTQEVRPNQLVTQHETSQTEKFVKPLEPTRSSTVPMRSKSTIRDEPPTPEQLQQQQATAKTRQEFLQGLRDNQQKAQDQIMGIYTLAEQNRGAEALEKFKQSRQFVAKYVDAQVFNTLEQYIAQVAMEIQVKPGALVAQRSSQVPTKPHSREEELIDRINGFVRENKIEVAYAEFHRSERLIKSVMTNNEFKQMKSMIENAYKIRKQGGSAAPKSP
jgi:hypothetical protein